MVLGDKCCILGVGNDVDRHYHNASVAGALDRRSDGSAVYGLQPDDIVTLVDHRVDHLCLYCRVRIWILDAVFHSYALLDRGDISDSLGPGDSARKV